MDYIPFLLWQQSEATGYTWFPHHLGKMYIDDWYEWLKYLGYKSGMETRNPFLPTNDISKTLIKLLSSIFGE